MNGGFYGEMVFFSVSGDLPPGKKILEERPWEINAHDAFYLAGKAEQPSHELVELTETEAFGSKPPRLQLSADDTVAIIGDISHSLKAGSEAILICSNAFQKAEKLAEKMGYRPAYAGEFLQLLRLLKKDGHTHNRFGWFFCYSGRKPGYAVIASYNDHWTEPVAKITFDTHIGNEGHFHGNMEGHCFFVRDAEA